MAVSRPSDKSYALRPEDLAWRLRRGLRKKKDSLLDDRYSWSPPATSSPRLVRPYMEKKLWWSPAVLLALVLCDGTLLAAAGIDAASSPAGGLVPAPPEADASADGMSAANATRPRVFVMHIQKTGLGIMRIMAMAHCGRAMEAVCPDSTCCARPPHLALDRGGPAPKIDDVSLQRSIFGADPAIRDQGCDVDFILNPGRTMLFYHYPWAPAHAPHGVVTLRDPAKRLVSAYGFQRGHGGPKLPLERGTSAAHVWWKGGLTKYALFPTVRSCQTKLILGVSCKDVFSIPPDGVERAVATLRTDFKFVGVTDEFARSAALYCAMFVGGACPCFERFARAKAVRAGTTSGHEGLLAQARELLVGDPDYALYHAGYRIYTENLCRHGLLPRARCDLAPLISHEGGRTKYEGGRLRGNPPWSNYRHVVAAIDHT